MVFLRYHQINRNKMYFSGSYLHTPQWGWSRKTSISSYFTPKALHRSSSGRAGSSSQSTRRTPRRHQCSLHSAMEEAEPSQEPQHDGQAGEGLQNPDLSVPGGLLGKDLPNPHPSPSHHLKPTNIYFKSLSPRFFSRILWGVPRGDASGIWNAYSILEFKTLFQIWVLCSSNQRLQYQSSQLSV